MFPKLLLIILVAGATAGALLVNRQHRIDTAHEISSLHQRLLSQEQTLWRLKSDLAERTRPEQIRRAKETLNASWVSIPSKPHTIQQPKIRIALMDDELPDEDLGG